MKLNHKFKYAIAISLSSLGLLIGFQNCSKTLNTDQTSNLSSQSPASENININNYSVSAFGNPVKLISKSNGQSSVEALSLCFVADLNGNVKTCSIKFSSMGVGPGKALFIKSKAVNTNSKCVIDMPDVHKEYSIGFQLNYEINVLSDQFEFQVVDETSVRIGPNTIRACRDDIAGKTIFRSDLPLQMFPYVDIKQQDIKFKQNRLDYKFSVDISEAYAKSHKIELIYGCRDAIGVYRESIIKQIKAPFPKNISIEDSLEISSTCNYLQLYFVSSWDGFQYTGTHNSGNLPLIESIGSKVVSLMPGECNDGLRTFKCDNTATPPNTPVAPVKCTYFSQRVNVEESGKATHCTNPGSAQLWEKSSCEYNSRGCGKGTCQCSTTGEIKNGVCVLTEKQKEIVKGLGLYWASLLTDASAPEVKAPTTNSCQPVTPPNNPTTPTCTNPPEEIIVNTCQQAGYSSGYAGSYISRRQYNCHTKTYSDWIRQDTCHPEVREPNPPTPVACTNPAPEVMTVTCQQAGYPANYVGSYISTRQLDCKTNQYSDWTRQDTCKPQQITSEPCYAYEFSDIVVVNAEYATSHCVGWNGTGLSGAQGTGKVFCEYNSLGCGTGKCQCYNTLRGVKLPNGTCSVQGKGSRGNASTINRCSMLEADTR